MSPTYREYRCRTCGKLQFKGVLVDSEVEVKCKGCRGMNVFRGEPASQYLCLVANCPQRVSLQSRGTQAAAA